MLKALAARLWQFCLWVRLWCFPVNEYHNLNLPHPIGKTGRGISLAFDCHGTPTGYLVGDGESLCSPVAFVPGRHICRNLYRVPTHADYLTAVMIAHQPGCISSFANVRDLRDVNPGDAEWRFLLEKVLFPTDRRGNAVRRTRRRTLHGARLGNDGSMRIALTPQAARWAWIPAADIPTFEMNVDADWTPAPAGLMNYFGIKTKENSGQVATDTLEPAKSESTEVATSAAA